MNPALAAKIRCRGYVTASSSTVWVRVALIICRHDLDRDKQISLHEWLEFFKKVHNDDNPYMDTEGRPGLLSDAKRLYLVGSNSEEVQATTHKQV